MMSFVPRNRIRNIGLWLPGILLLACALRLIYLVQYSQLPDWDQLTVDNWYHHNWAQTIADGNIVGDTTYFRAPFYIYCLGLLYALAGPSLWIARLFGAAIGMASVGMTFLLGRRLFNHRVGLIAAAFHAIYPIMIYFEGELLLDSLFCLTVQLVLHRFMIAFSSERCRDLLYAGLLTGLSAITRPTILVIVPLALITLIILYRHRGGFKRAGIYFAGLLLVTAPVLIRNVAVAEDPVLIASQGGVNLYIGNNDQADGLSASMPEPLGRNWQIRRITHLAEEATGQRLKPGEVSDYWSGKAIAWIVSHPKRFTELVGKKIYYQFINREISNNRPLGPFMDKFSLFAFNPLSFGLIITLAIAGLALGWKPDRRSLFVLAFMAIYVLGVSLFFYNSRFRLPLLPLYLVLAANGALAIFERIRNRRAIPLYTVASVAAVAAFSFFPLLSLPTERSSHHLLSRGIYYFGIQEYSIALDNFRKAARFSPDLPDLNLNIGACFFRMGNADSARFYFDAERTLHPGRTTSYQNQASLDLVNNRFAQARTQIGLVLDLTPYDVNAHIINIRALGGDTAITGENLRHAIELAAAATNNDIYLLNEAAIQLNSRGEYTASESILVRALTSRPPPIETNDLAFAPNFPYSRKTFSTEKGTTNYLLGFLSGLKKNISGVISYSRQAIDLDSSLAEAYINLANAYYLTERRNKADSVIAIAIGKFPGNSQLQQMTGKPRW